MNNIEEKVEEALNRHEEYLQRTLLAFSNRIYSNILFTTQTVNEYGSTVNQLSLTIPSQSRNTIIIAAWLISFDPTNISSLTLQLGRFSIKQTANLASGLIDSIGKSVLLRPNDTRIVSITTTGGTPSFVNALLMGFSVGDQGQLS